MSGNHSLVLRVLNPLARAGGDSLEYRVTMVPSHTTLDHIYKRLGPRLVLIAPVSLKSL